MKKILALILCLFMLMGVVCPLTTAESAAYAGVAVSSAEGVWNAVSAETDGMTLDKSMLEMMDMLIKLTLNADGTGILETEGEAGEISWTEDAGVVTISVDGDSTTLNVNEDGTLSGDFGGVIIAFEKGDGSEGEPAEAMSEEEQMMALLAMMAEAAGEETPVETSADVDTSALIGTWFDGDTTNFTIYEDGTCVATDQYGDSMMDWAVVDGVPMITTGFWCDSPMILNEDGTLYVSDGWSVEKTFTFGEGEIRVGSTLAEPTGTIAASSAEEFFGEWKGETMVMESGTFALADMMMVMDLTISADGTLTLYDGATDSTTWTYADGYMTAADGMIELSLMDNGQLCMAQEFNILYLSRAEGGAAPEEDSVDAPAASTDAFVGTWVSDFYKLELYEDGTGKYFYPDGTYDDKVWVIKGAGIEFTDLWWGGSAAVIDADGSLNVDNGWYVFQPENGTEAPAASEVSSDVPAEAMPLIGEWLKPDNGNVLNINTDGTMVLTYPSGSVQDMTWTVENGAVIITSGVWEFYEMTVNADDILEIGLFEYERVGEPYAAPVEEESDGAAAEMEDFVGRWIGTTMEREGQTYALTDFDMIMEIALDINGNVSMYDGETIETGRWSLVDGKADIDGMLLTLMNDGTLVAEDPEGAKVVFTGFVGTWKACYLSTGGLTGDLRSMGITSTLVLNADGTGSIDFPTPEEGSWYREDGILRFGENGMPIEILSGGFLKYGSDLGGYIVFSQDETAVWDPSMLAPVEPVATEVPVIPVVPEAPAAQEAPANNGAVDMQALLNRKFVAKTYTSFGQTMDASMLGAEYSMLFYENGTCDFGLAGMVVPNLPWGLQKVATGLTEVDAFVINYYGTMFNAVITDTGFDMDYYGTMTLHFVPAE